MFLRLSACLRQQFYLIGKLSSHKSRDEVNIKAVPSFINLVNSLVAGGLTSMTLKPNMTIVKIVLIVLSMTEFVHFVEPCFITNCPRGGKRSGPLLQNPSSENDLATLSKVRPCQFNFNWNHINVYIFTFYTQQLGSALSAVLVEKETVLDQIFVVVIPLVVSSKLKKQQCAHFKVLLHLKSVMSNGGKIKWRLLRAAWILKLKALALLTNSAALLVIVFDFKLKLSAITFNSKCRWMQGGFCLSTINPRN